MKEEQTEILETFKPFLWSHDVSHMDLETNKTRIITNVLNWGTKQATDLLFQVYSREDIEQVIKHPKPGEWNDKSLNYWSVIFNITPKNPKHVLRNFR